MPSWTAEEIVRVLLAAGFFRERQRATSHAVFRHADGRQVVISMHSGDVRPGTLSAIGKQSRLPFRR